jgi:HAD superfamily hydrolase (TIGR01549 family)
VGDATATPSGGWRPRLVLFDLDDTLCDYAAARLARLRRAFAGPDPASPLVAGAALERMIASSLAIHPHGADHFAEVFAAHGTGDAEAAAWATAWYRENALHGLELFAETQGALAAVRAAFADPAVTIGVVTNGPAGIQREKVRMLGIDRLVDFVVISGELGAWKPDPAIFREALRRGGASASEAVFVGDSLEHDIAGALSVGIRTIWVNPVARPRGPGDPAPDHVVRNVAEVPPLLAALARGLHG